VRLSIIVIVLVLISSALGASAAAVGFEQIEVPNGAEPPLHGAVWYPTKAVGQQASPSTEVALDRAPIDGNALPLVVLSHGGGGSFKAHHDTALALAEAGFVVAAISHAGDTYDDQSQVLKPWRRPVQLHKLVSYMLDGWPQHDHVDKSRVGAFGFSNGAFTVLVAAGGVPDLGKLAPFCQAHAEHDLCRALAQAGVDPHLGKRVPADAWVSDSRIKSIAIAAVAFGFAFDHSGLVQVRMPVQLWHAQNDLHQPEPWYDEPVRDSLPRPPDYRIVQGAGHYDFLPPCPPSLAAKAPTICDDPSGFDRAAFHQSLNSELVRFFRTTLQ
jgi:predicted dienelactone hydrolase